ncbi:hypothetical protein EASAB2608_06781 [Streptomyces sp. EAS-AB2608]|nr:hypothetical protein EASAB2608_06781 [Streptomyces sp. EAS-AB2608]
MVSGAGGTDGCCAGGGTGPAGGGGWCGAGGAGKPAAGGGGGTGAGPWEAPGCGPGWCAADTQPACGTCPGWWGGGSGDPTACCIRCHSVSYRQFVLAAGARPAAYRTVPSPAVVW